MSTTTSMNFLARDTLYADEKPYTLKFTPPAGLSRTNIKSDTHDQVIDDIRGRERDFTLEGNGFIVIPIENKLSYEDFDDDEKVKEIYLPQIAHLLRSMLGASRVQIFEHLVRKRHVSFPVATGGVYAHHQPTTAVHIDMTQDWASKVAGRLNHKIGVHELPSKNYQFINVWKPLRGPVKDWPLALCDLSTLDDCLIQGGDVVFEDLTMENALLHHSSEYKWYYISDQQATEAWVFLQGDSSGGPYRETKVPLTLLSIIETALRIVNPGKVLKFELLCSTKIDASDTADV